MRSALLRLLAPLFILAIVKAQPTVPSRTTHSDPAQTRDATLSAVPVDVKRRCEGNESCASITAGPEVPIAVTTTMMSTVLVPCTTTTTVIDSQTSTLTIYSSLVQTQTVSVEGASTVTVWLITPAPSIVASTYMTQDVFTFTKDRTEVSFWTSTAPVQTVVSTIDGGKTSWTVTGEQSAVQPVPTSTAQAVPPPVIATPAPAPAWTPTTAAGGAGTSWTPLPAPVITSSTPIGIAPGAFGTLTGTTPFGGVSPNGTGGVVATGSIGPSGKVSVTDTVYATQGSPFVSKAERMVDFELQSKVQVGVLGGMAMLALFVW